jgi:hypothetical protein
VRLSNTFNLKEFKKYMLIKGSEKLRKIIINKNNNICSDCDMTIDFNEFLDYLDENGPKSDIDDYSASSNNNLDIIEYIPIIISENCLISEEENLKSILNSKN